MLRLCYGNQSGHIRTDHEDVVERKPRGKVNFLMAGAASCRMRTMRGRIDGNGFQGEVNGCRRKVHASRKMESFSAQN